ncbi:DUF4190 domain-containing protein [Actinoplanes teichomyceticus]|uniref:Putative regulator of septum formation n=1 Tax=Actinoplanes teichomyceticus TaxID=1867 RepID=A0A561WKK2_ACTTI|nr:DUF4190 domain-containing protein [Actinoplanes teichomyceticus]TWG24360.1 putative regulator of septum formation [Actinoplanes teichomyceticus]GIF12788.1 hypothetical protein Ate01nite_28200 [Actinoplanes teichomyceticus]
MNEEIPGQPHPAPGLTPLPQQADPLAAIPATGDPLSAPAPVGGNPMYGVPPVTPQPGYPAQPGHPDPAHATPPGGYPPPAYPGQPYPAQQYPGQQYPGYPGQPYPGHPAPYPMYGPPDSGRTNGFAIASLIFGILGGLLGIVFGLIALGQIRRRGDRGRGLAVAGLSLSVAWFTAIVALIAIGLAIGDDSETSTTVTSGGRPSAASSEPADVRTDKLAAGDCIATITDADTVYDLPVVACSQRHEGEVYTVFTLPAGAFPGDAKVEAQAEKRCDRSIEPYAIGRFADAEIYYVYPSSRSWTVDRSVTCIAVAPEGAKWTGSMVK